MNPTDYAKLIVANIKDFASVSEYNINDYAETLISKLAKMFNINCITVGRSYIDNELFYKIPDYKDMTDDEWFEFINSDEFTIYFYNFMHDIIRMYISDNIIPLILRKRTKK